MDLFDRLLSPCETLRDTVPALPGCVIYGRTVGEACEMAKEAISGYIASLRKHQDPIPPMKRRWLHLWTWNIPANLASMDGFPLPQEH